MESRILELVAGIDPVPDESALLAEEAEFEAVRRLVKERSIMLQPTIETDGPGPDRRPTRETDAPFGESARRRRNRIWFTAGTLAAAAAVVLIIAIAGGAFDSAGESGVVDSPDSDVAVSDEAGALAAEGLALTEEHMAAYLAADIDTAMALLTTINETADRQMYEFNAVFIEQGMGATLNECEVRAGNEELVIIDCSVERNDPVFAAIGAEQQVWPFHYSADGLSWSPSPGSATGDVARAIATYLRDRHPVAYEQACDPVAYEQGTINTNAGLALTGPCGELAATHAEDIAQWIRDGQPES